ncbi:hypothetical protein [Azospirillum sp. sgz301742]
MTAAKPPTAWVLSGIDAQGTLVTRISEIAAKEHLSVSEWVERWLRVVLDHHYAHSDIPPGRLRDQLAATQATLRHNLEVLSEQLGRLYESVETAQRHTAEAEQEIHTAEDELHRREDALQERSQREKP